MSTIETGQGAGRKITPCLWFDGKAEEAANLYVRCSRIQGSPTSLAMATQGQTSVVNPRVQ